MTTKDTSISLAELATKRHQYMKAVYSDACAICGIADNPLHIGARKSTDKKKELDSLWQQLLSVIDQSVDNGNRILTNYSAKREYGALECLVRAECKAERLHRRGFNGGLLPVRDMAHLHIMKNMASGANGDIEPRGTLFLDFRHSAAEAITIGYQLRLHLSPAWIQSALALTRS